MGGGSNGRCTVVGEEGQLWSFGSALLAGLLCRPGFFVFCIALFTASLCAPRSFAWSASKASSGFEFHATSDFEHHLVSDAFTALDCMRETRA